MERSIQVHQLSRATNDAVFTREIILDPKYREAETRIMLSKPMTDEELRNLFSDGPPLVELYYEDGKVVALRKVGIWGRPTFDAW